MIDVPDDVEELVRQRPVEQIISVATETTIDEATPTLDGAELDVTQRVKAKAAPRNIPQLERAASASNASASASWSRPNGASSAPESARLSDRNKLLQTGFLSNWRPQRDAVSTIQTSPAMAPVTGYIAPAYAVYAAAAPMNEYVPGTVSS